MVFPSFFGGDLFEHSDQQGADVGKPQVQRGNADSLPVLLPATHTLVMEAWAKEHPFLALVAATVIGGILALIGWVFVQPYFVTHHATLEFVDFKTWNDAPQEKAKAYIRVHNRGDASAQVCYIYWDKGDGSELARSTEFGLAPDESQGVTLTRMPSSYSNYSAATVKDNTYAVIKCNGDRLKSEVVTTALY